MSTRTLRSMFAAAVTGLLASAAAVQPAAAGADTSFCGGPGGKAAEILERIKAMPGIKEIHRTPEYIAYQDAATQAVYTFTGIAQKAHPAAVCRRPVQKGDALELQMAIVCEGAARHCEQLEGDFKLLNAKMQADINNQIQAGKK